MLDYIKELVLAAGDKTVEKSYGIADSQLKFKNDKDLVSAVDQEVEHFIIDRIRERYPDHRFFGEETGKTAGSSEYCWVIDPIDGTTSFVHGQPFYSVSVALQKNSETILGVVYAPRLNEFFCSEKGAGTYLNGKKVTVSHRDKLGSSVLATGFACLRAGKEDNNLKNFNRIVPELRGIRRFGSAALDLAYVSCGYLEGFWELDLKLYDIAAGVLLVTEAGGTVSDFRGGNNYPDSGTAATNGKIHNELLELLDFRKE